MKICRIEGCGLPVWGKGLCKRHTSYKPLKKSRLSGKFKPLSPEIVENIDKQNAFFLSIWKKLPHCSQISGEKLYGFSSLYFHHILPKSKFKEAMYDEENIAILLPEEHGNIEINKFRYEKINERRKLLEKKYNI